MSGIWHDLLCCLFRSKVYLQVDCIHRPVAGTHTGRELEKLSIGGISSSHGLARRKIEGLAQKPKRLTRKAPTGYFK